MGQDASSPVDETVPPETLETRTIDGVARYIKDGKAKRIVVMTGAGISTSAGIPDFRSPDTGLYANLARLNLPYAEAVFDISYFRGNPYPFYTLAHELYPGKYRPTITHSFISLLEKKELLHMLFTQNIDCLEREAGVPGHKIVEAHGSFAAQRCIECKRPYPDEDMKEMIKTKDVPHCQDESCLGLVKPDIVFFGEQLPESFFKNRTKPAEADLAIIMGTSLTVQPFASLPQFVGEGTPRVLINLERVGGIGSRSDDVVILGNCDDGVRKLAEACGWLEELEEMWAKTVPKVAAEQLGKQEGEESRTKDEKLQDEIDKLTKDVDETLKITKGHEEALNQHLGQKEEKIAEKATEGSSAKTTEAESEQKSNGQEALRGTPQTETNSKDDEASPEGGGAGKDSEGGLDHVFVGKKSAL
ncbi:NAD-dependent histone deacetylase SIR2 [Rhizodiscina lignyota]|uniref:NAD-dependent protein deacetylase n=1 Tax=Rhizodiscina lignyota TaxID=1504668 RepID=A0A9P4MBP5_9PEZI|nr:NAD-dependent histone deacetylase SIR2 [Rhizodiscina lignyota]